MKSASELGAARSLDELLAVQTRIAGAQMARVVGYWASLYENQLAAINAARRETSAAR